MICVRVHVRVRVRIREDWRGYRPISLHIRTLTSHARVMVNAPPTVNTVPIACAAVAVSIPSIVAINAVYTGTPGCIAAAVPAPANMVP